MKIGIKFAICILTIIIELFLYTIVTIISIWTSKLIKILFNINLTLIFFTAIYPLIIICIFFISKKKLFNSKVYKFLIQSNVVFNTIIYFLIEIINFYNYQGFSTFINNCPFTLTSDLYSNNSSYFETKRCELYNIYNNSRYKYQYICSYNPYDDLKNEKTKDGLQKMQCLQKINNQDNFKLIDEFTKIYQKMNISQLFYCNRIDIPIKNEFIPEKYCNNGENLNLKVHILLQISNMIATIFNFLFIDLIKYMQKIIQNEILNEIERIIREKEDNCSTDNDESNSNNVSFIEEDEINMIVENNSVHNIDMNMTDLVENEQQEKQD